MDDINIDKTKINQTKIILTSRRNEIDKGDIYKGNDYYNAVKKYNNDVKNYNNLLKITKEKIINYNNQINSFNECVMSKQ